ncbi:hypothetical protein TUM12370_24210 [Salmonella enterica subsp. enterica serovar Choleraesuis]|nr:hypothetical protein TUM12370_24210 [Salmonella enterica subsp. enterica serovar Choleraesuis]
MSMYETGTITAAKNSTTITGSGTAWLDKKFGISPQCVLVIRGAGTVDMYAIQRVDSNTQLTVTRPIATAVTGAGYGIIVAESMSVQAWANQLAASSNYTQSLLDSIQTVMTGTGSVVLTAPNGQQTTVSSFKKLTDDMATKASQSALIQLTNDVNNKIGYQKYTLSAPTGARTGLLYPIILLGARSKTKVSISTRTAPGNDPMNNCSFAGDVSFGGWTDLGSQVSGTYWRYNSGEVAIDSLWRGYEGDSFGAFYVDGGAFPVDIIVREDVSVVVPTANYTRGTSTFLWGTTTPENGVKVVKLAGFSASGFYHFGGNFFEGNDRVWSTANTTKASDGTLKAASPVVKIFSDGRYETNGESEGVSVERQGVGQYLVNGCFGLNSDAAWGGIDGGFDIPTDRNRQPLVWLDYEVNADGSVLVKTYHRMHPAAPVFARNEIEGLNDGDPIDIPADQFVSVRVNMPEVESGPEHPEIVPAAD